MGEATATASATLARKAAAAASASAKRAQALVALIERRKLRITEDFYDIGEALRELQKPKLYEARRSAAAASTSCSSGTGS